MKELLNEKLGLHNLHSATNNIRDIEPRMVKWASHVASTGAIRNMCQIFAGKSKGRHNFER
jgi:hypothetical protein